MVGEAVDWTHPVLWPVTGPTHRSYHYLLEPRQMLLEMLGEGGGVVEGAIVSKWALLAGDGPSPVTLGIPLPFIPWWFLSQPVSCGVLVNLSSAHFV